MLTFDIGNCLASTSTLMFEIALLLPYHLWLVLLCHMIGVCIYIYLCFATYRMSIAGQSSVLFML